MDLLLNPGITIFGFTIYWYAIIIVFGMSLALLLMHHLMKRKALNPDDMYTYALIILPIAIFSARLYFFLFPYKGETSDWSMFFHFRQGGIAIYGGVIGGFLALLITSLIKKQNTFDISDCIAPGLMLAQAIGRWGNFVNQEAYGNLVTEPSLQWFPYAVFIENQDAWYQATFFYESFINIIGFVILMLLIFKWKGMRRFFSTAFYFIWYGFNRLFVESLRSDSLYFEIFGVQTNIKVSQLVSVALIAFGLVLLAISYRKELKRFFCKLFGKTVEPIPEEYVIGMRAFPLEWALKVQEEKALKAEAADMAAQDNEIKGNKESYDVTDEEFSYYEDEATNVGVYDVEISDDNDDKKN